MGETSVGSVEVEFENRTWDLVDCVSGDYAIKIARWCRTVPYPGMRQPVPVGAIMGLETRLDTQYRKKGAIGHDFQLFCGDRLIQTGKIHGGDNLLIPPDVAGVYRVVITPSELREALPDAFVAKTASDQPEPA